jgi:hypothetical protein
MPDSRFVPSAWQVCLRKRQCLEKARFERPNRPDQIRTIVPDLPTSFPTRQNRRASSGAGRSNPEGSPSALQSQTAQSDRSR